MQTPHAAFRHICLTCPTARPANLSANIRITATNLEQPQGIGADDIAAIPCALSGCIDIGRTEGPKPPPGSESRREKPRIIHETQLSPAIRIRRVEPAYPILPKQLGRSGHVELRAVIATDGTIQSLQVVSGDPLFYKSALEAVRQWRYRPTVLNGEPVEIDTFITVIYNIDR
jgi:protein TonB